MASVTINAKNTYIDFNALLIKRDISPPEIKDVPIDIPYRNGDICMTYINGNKPSYNPRTLTYDFEFVEYPKTKLRDKITLFENWIMSCGECELYDDTDMRYHFINARPISCKESESGFKCTVTVTFKAYPFRLSENYANATWDSFCFDTDYLNPTEYICKKSGSNTFRFYNYGLHDICPEAEYIKSGSGTLTLYKTDMGKPITIAGNVKKLDGFILKPGLNEFYLSGNINAGIRLIACEEVI